MKPSRKSRRLSRNSPCPCGSGVKYKRCCLALKTFDLPGGLVITAVTTGSRQARELEQIGRELRGAQRQGHEIEDHDCPICRYLEREELGGGDPSVLPAA